MFCNLRATRGALFPWKRAPPEDFIWHLHDRKSCPLLPGLRIKVGPLTLINSIGQSHAGHSQGTFACFTAFPHRWPHCLAVSTCKFTVIQELSLSYLWPGSGPDWHWLSVREQRQKYLLWHAMSKAGWLCLGRGQPNDKMVFHNETGHWRVLLTEDKSI